MRDSLGDKPMLGQGLAVVSKAIQFLRETRRMSREDAEQRVVAVAAELGIG